MGVVEDVDRAEEMVFAIFKVVDGGGVVESVHRTENFFFAIFEIVGGVDRAEKKESNIARADRGNFV